MRISTGLRGALVAAIAIAGIGMSTVAKADSGSVQFNVVKGGFIIGGSGGNGVLRYHGRTYPISIGGLSYGFTVGLSNTEFRGRVTNIRRPSDIAGVYAAAGAGAALGVGGQAIVLTNPNGAVLTLSGRQVGAIVSADLNGMAISIR
jgi:hypothetical protein